MLNHVAKRKFGGTLVGALVVAFALAGLPKEAAANQCGPRDAILDHLNKQYKEERRVLGLVGSAGVMEAYVSSAGSWTILVTTSAGTTCIIAAGESWEDVPVKVAEPAA